MLPETVAELAGHVRIIALKEARSESERMEALLPLRGDGFAVLSGDDPTACRAMLAGADGIISVASNVLPVAFRRLCDLARAGRRDEAEALDARMQSAYDFLGVEPNPIPVKAVLAHFGFGHGLRLPLLPLSAAHAVRTPLVAADIQTLEHTLRDSLAA
jgi:4-hydroxy-tetrahydrodipicolinate synthase